jgi:OOP family OmpA-OmpF porin
MYANILLSYPQVKVEIVGHADATGSAEYNQKLSEERAQAIADKFEQLGVESTQMIIRGLGERSPIASNDNMEGRAKNRRVEITIQGFEY